MTPKSAFVKPVAAPAERRPLIVLGIASSEAALAIERRLQGLGCACRVAHTYDRLEALMAEGAECGAILDTHLCGKPTLAMRHCYPRLMQTTPVLYRVPDEEESFEEVLAAVRAGAYDVMFGLSGLHKLDGLVSEATFSRRPAEPPAQGLGDRGSSATEPADSRASISHARGLEAAHEHAEKELAKLLIGDSPAMDCIRRRIVEVAETNASVMICGESGTGKELVAQAIHQFSRVSAGPFVPVNMAAIPQGLAESLLFGHAKGSFTSAAKDQTGYCQSADGGTLFMDEISEMEVAIQPKLLRFLQTGVVQPIGAPRPTAVATRIITATNRDPGELVRSGQLREDLFYRLHVVPISIPPLRERPGDIRQLAAVFLDRYAAEHRRPARGFTEEALAALERLPLPGNVRQLENLVEQIVIFTRGALVTVSDIPTAFSGGPGAVRTGAQPTGPQRRGDAATPDAGPAAPTLKRFQQQERAAILEALQQSRGHVVDAAELLGLSQATVYRKIKEYQIPRERRRRKPKPR
ncbi:sigma-54 interaction domain-containing protein [Pirellulimonas nuda]|uniref:sigma-54 interaction domain-containing protein n=1 Tax=Pirellulimonas nuda TaxID=2528009 RepID=UPI0018D3585E|nr:sigma-54 dependent transcriptional regulator [Pirellulimonas nuda]